MRRIVLESISPRPSAPQRLLFPHRLQAKATHASPSSPIPPLRLTAPSSSISLICRPKGPAACARGLRSLGSEARTRGWEVGKGAGRVRAWGDGRGGRGAGEDVGVRVKGPAQAGDSVGGAWRLRRCGGMYCVAMIASGLLLTAATDAIDAIQSLSSAFNARRSSGLKLDTSQLIPAFVVIVRADVPPLRDESNHQQHIRHHATVRPLCPGHSQPPTMAALSGFEKEVYKKIREAPNSVSCARSPRRSLSPCADPPPTARSTSRAPRSTRHSRAAPSRMCRP